MNKYIDANRLKAEIKKQIRMEELNFAALGGGGQTFCIHTLKWMLNLIDSLPQEKSTRTCKTCGFYENNCPFIRNTFKPYPNKVCKYYNYSAMKEQEQSGVDLKKEMDKLVSLEYVSQPDEEWDMCIARHFYKLGLNVGKKV